METRSNQPDKKPGCWMRFKSLFEDRGFDLEYEYTSHQPRTVPVLGETQTEEGYRRIEDRKLTENRNSSAVTNTTVMDGELSGVINFYEQFATLGDDDKTDDLWRKNSTFKNRVSMRPSMFLTNIAEETSLGEGDEIEVVSRNCLRIENKFYLFKLYKSWKRFSLLVCTISFLRPLTYREIKADSTFISLFAHKTVFDKS